jgi:hypothetical protein
MFDGDNSRKEMRMKIKAMKEIFALFSAWENLSLLTCRDLLFAGCSEFLGGRSEYGRPASFGLVGELDLIAFENGGVI